MTVDTSGNRVTGDGTVTSHLDDGYSMTQSTGGSSTYYAWGRFQQDLTTVVQGTNGDFEVNGSGHDDYQLEEVGSGYVQRLSSDEGVDAETFNEYASTARSSGFVLSVFGQGRSSRDG